jgi:anionic cell wall polymer biosynthesis LytR-Cps2A-Psr (LCP) family protein
MSSIQEESTMAANPEVNMPVTINYYSDRRAATITKIIDAKKIEVRFNEVVCMDYYKSEYDVLPNLMGGELIFTKRKNGRWVVDGQPAKNGTGLSLGIHDHFIDPSF